MKSLSVTPPSATTDPPAAITSLSAAIDPGAAVRYAVSGTTYTAVLVDFDDTLYLGCSTRDYLATVRPRLLVRALSLVVRIFFRLTRATSHTRFIYEDWLMVLAVTVLVPWTLPLWRRSVAQRGRAHRNNQLVDALAPVPEIQVVTFGFRPVVSPLLNAIQPKARLLIAANLQTGYRLRTEGKRAAVERQLGARMLEGAVVVTDSLADEDLLLACQTPLLLVWRPA